MLHAHQSSHPSIGPRYGHRDAAQEKALLRALGFALLLLLSSALAMAVLAWNRRNTAARDEHSVLQDRRDLRVYAADLHRAFLVEGLGSGSAGLHRADSLADRFHILAGDATREGADPVSMRATEDAFAVWYVQAHRVAQGLSAGDDGSGSGAELATIAYRHLDDRLASEVRATMEKIAVGRVMARRAVAAAWSLAALACAAGLLGLMVKDAPRSSAPVAGGAEVRAAELVEGSAAPAHGRRAGSAAATRYAWSQPSQGRMAHDQSAAPTYRAPRHFVPRGASGPWLAPAEHGGTATLNEAIGTLESLLQASSCGARDRQAPLERARAGTSSTAAAAARLARTAASLSSDAGQLAALLRAFRVRGMAA
jgi:hypothetical protein